IRNDANEPIRYERQMKIYEKHWNRWLEKFKNVSNFEFQVPVCQGWDNRPIGGSYRNLSGKPNNPLADEAQSTPEQFAQMLYKAKTYSDKYKDSHGDTITVCCWNEYMEGNHIEPTKKYKDSYLK